MADPSRERDLVLAPNEYAFVIDETKGSIQTYVGPLKISLSQTEKPVVFDGKSKRFTKSNNLDDAIQLFSIAPEGWYMTLKNPSPSKPHPDPGKVNTHPELSVGRKVNIPGPDAFALWPGQMVKIIQGHHLRSNQYLLVRVYDEQGAYENWSKAVMKPASGDEPASETKAGKKEKSPATAPPVRANDLTIGKQFIIKGTEVSFYIPPTGIEVVPEKNGNYVRDAITLERLEYCILLDEDGNKRFVQGPEVVFPEPTETFVELNGTRKFKAIELNEISGIYVKVIADYGEGNEQYEVGDELFITGKDQMIYFPREEHALIKYGSQDIHYAIAIPAGEARYVLDRMSGRVFLKEGPAMFLPDPRREVVVRRALSDKLCDLIYPGNLEVLSYNRELRGIETLETDVLAGGGSGKLLEDLLTREARRPRRMTDNAAYTSNLVGQSYSSTTPASTAFAGDSIGRRQAFTKPRAITLDTKYEGAVNISVWTGYAVMITDNLGNRRVVQGPSRTSLQYDEVPEILELSTGNPKTTDKLFQTAYLRVLNNKVSDTITAETKDLCQVNVKLSYRVDFEGDPTNWFNVENYVKFLCDHLRSIIRHVVKQHDIEDFYANNTTILRDAVLGKHVEGGARPGKAFPENGMRIKDVEVLDVQILDSVVNSLLVDAQRTAVAQAIEVNQSEAKLLLVRRGEAVKREIAAEEYVTSEEVAKIRIKTTENDFKVQVALIQTKADQLASQLKLQLANEEAQNAVSQTLRDREKESREQQLALAEKEMDQRIKELAADVDACVKKAGAITPDLIAALQAFSDRSLLAELGKAMAPLAITGDESVTEMLTKLVRGMPVSKWVNQLSLPRVTENQ